MAKTTLPRSAAALAACCVALTGACAGNDAPATATTAGSGLRATVKEFAIAIDPQRVAAGAVRVTVKNDGKNEHEFVAFKTDLPLDKLPLNADGTEVDEKGAGIEHMDPEAEDIRPGSSKTITLDLSAGRYVFICNVVGHYSSGMRTELIVS
jgi:uncharacterized cupredoxin-like copper-binding protein